MSLSTRDLAAVAAGMRAFCLAANKHPGGSLSAVEAVTSLYFGGAANLAAESHPRDHFVYSKGHAAAPLYWALWAHGLIPGLSLGDLLGFGQIGHRLPRMPTRSPQHGMDMSTGALGQGLSFACGMALGLRRSGSTARVYALLGDGECTEGQVYEAAFTAHRLGLRNVTALLDANGFGSVADIDPAGWKARWLSFGWDVWDVNGHDLPEVGRALEATHAAGGPSMIILHTVKGKGLLPPVEGTSELSGEADPRYIPAVELEETIGEALRIIDREFPAAGPARTGAFRASRSHKRERHLRREALLEGMSEYPAGRDVVAKKIGGDLAEELAGHPVLLLSPDAIRNSGILPRMRKVGSWSYDNAASNVLQCVIAEQDAASLAAGMSAAGLRPILFSMEGFYWRMLDQVRESICFPGLPVLLVGTSGGIGDPLGPMVQSDACMAVLDCMLGLTVFEAADANWAKLLCAEALAAGAPAYLRLPHEATPVRNSLSELAGLDLSSGCWIMGDPGRPDITLVTAGAMRETVLAVAAKMAADRVRARVIEVFSVTRARAAPQGTINSLIPPCVPAVSVHNAPSRVLRSLLPAGSVAIGADGYGMSGWPQSRLYSEAGLGEDHVYDRARWVLAGGHRQ